MERWSGRVALVTGASAGIGAAIVKELVLKGMKVVGLARRVDRVEQLKSELKGAAGQLYPLKGDVTQEADILAAFEWVAKNLGGVDVLVNNAGVCVACPTEGGSTADWRNILEVNVLGLTVCTREALKSMRSRDVDDGHIIHINSVAGHSFPVYPGVEMYYASKHAVTALTEGLRTSLLKSHIRVTSLSPGFVLTEMTSASKWNRTEEEVAQTPSIQPKDVADALLYVLGTPPHVQVHELTIKPVGEQF